ncbi:MAG: imidazole glycerol phosphate synthase subunit HisH [Sphingomonadales bacterium]
MRVAIIDSGCANLASVAFGLARAGAEPFVTKDPAEIAKAPRVILPGVGAAATAMANLKKAGLNDLLPTLKQPVLGICLGMQILYEKSQENEVDCLGILSGKVTRLSAGSGIRVPHMGWNQLKIEGNIDPLVRGIPDKSYAYFVHSYYLPEGQNTIVSTDYGTGISAIVRKNNFWGCQFHPELSGRVGQKILSNFVRP